MEVSQRGDRRRGRKWPSHVPCRWHCQGERSYMGMARSRPAWITTCLRASIKPTFLLPPIAYRSYPYLCPILGDLTLLGLSLSLCFCSSASLRLGRPPRHLDGNRVHQTAASMSALFSLCTRLGAHHSCPDSCLG